MLLLLHGGFGNMEDFNPVISKLEKDFRIIGVDSRGQGKSTLGNYDLSYKLIQSDIEVILKHLGINELSIIGFSDGGIVAYRLAVLTKLTINKLITIGSRWHENNVTETKEVLSGVTAAMWRGKFLETVRVYEKLNPEADFDKLALQVVKMWLNQASYPNEAVKNITAYTLIIRGDKDHLTTRKFVVDIADLIPNANLANIPFAGHTVHADQLELLMMTINIFNK